MASLLSRAVAYRRSPHFKRLAKFLSVSIISTVVTQTVLFLTYHEWNVASAMECNVIATCCATFPAYYLNRTWTWGKTGKSHLWREVVPFWTIAFIGLVLSTVAVGVAAHNADQISHSKDVRAAFVQLANFVTYGLIWVGRYAIFNHYLFGERTWEQGAQSGGDEQSARQLSEGAAEHLVARPAVADPADYFVREGLAREARPVTGLAAGDDVSATSGLDPVPPSGAARSADDSLFPQA